MMPANSTGSADGGIRADDHAVKACSVAEACWLRFSASARSTALIPEILASATRGWIQIYPQDLAASSSGELNTEQPQQTQTEHGKALSNCAPLRGR